MKKKYISALSTTMAVLLLSSQTFAAVKWNTVYDKDTNVIDNNTTIIGSYKFPAVPTKLNQYMEAARSIAEGEDTNVAVFNRGKRQWIEKTSQEVLDIPKEIVITNDGVDMTPAEGELLWDKDVNVSLTKFASSMYDSASKTLTVKGTSYKLENPAEADLVAAALEVLSTIKEGNVFKVENGVISIESSGGGEGLADSEAPNITTDLLTTAQAYTLNQEDVSPLKVVATGTGEVTYQWYRQDVGTQPLVRGKIPTVGQKIEGATTDTYTPPVDKVGTTLYYVVVANTEAGKDITEVASNMATVVVSEGELTDTEFTVSDYVYNNESKTTDTMGKLTGTALSGTKITIEANFTELATASAGTDGKWEATFPRQNAGTKIKVTAVADGKTKVQTIEVKAADTKDIEDFGKNIDLNKLIEVKDNLHVSEDGKDVSNGYWIKSQTEADAFIAYVNLIDAVLGYKYQISTVDLGYVQNIALSTLKTYEGKIHQAGEVSTKATVSISRDGKGTVEVSYKGGSHSVTDGVYKVEADKNTSVTFKAAADAGNHFVKWVVDGKDDTTSGTTLTKEVKANMSVKAVFAKDGEEPVEEVTITTEAKNGKITAKKAEDNTPITIGADGTFKVEKGTEVVFAATGDTDYKFSKWVVNNTNDGTTNTITKTITADMTVKAEFTYAQIAEGQSRVTTIATNGKIAAEADGTSITIGTDGTFDIDDDTQVTFTATPNSRYEFSKWLVDGVDAGTTNTLTKTITADTTVEAVFAEEGEQPGDTYKLTVNKSGNGTGTVMLQGEGIDASTEGNVYTVAKGTRVTFTATPDSDSSFVDWTVGSATRTENPTTVTVDSDTTVAAQFTKKTSQEDSATPSITEGSYTYVDKNGNLFAQISGKAGANAKITFKDGEGNVIAPLETVTADTTGAWTAIIPRQDGGVSIIAIAKETGKNPAESTAYEVKAATDKAPLTNLIDEITKKLEGVKVSDDGITDKDGAALTTGDKYISQVEYDAVDTMKKLLDKLNASASVSTYDIDYVNTVAKPAIDAVVIKIAQDQETSPKLTLSKSGDGIVTISAADGDIIGDPSTVTDGVYTIKSGATVTINAIPNGSNEIAGWVVDGKADTKADATRNIKVDNSTAVQVLFANAEIKTQIKETVDKIDKVTENGTKAVEVTTTEATPSKEIIGTLVENKLKTELPADTKIVSVKVLDQNTDARALVSINYKAEVTLKCGDVTFTIIVDITVTAGTPDKAFDSLAITDISNGVVGEKSTVKVNGVPSDATGFDLKVKSGDVTVNYLSDTQQLEVTPTKAMTGADVTVTATATGYEAKDVTFKVTATENEETQWNVIVNTASTDGAKGVVKVTGADAPVSGNVYKVNKGASVIFEALADNDSEFDNWTVGTETKTTNPMTIDSVDSDLTVTANFKLKNQDKEDSTKPVIDTTSYKYSSETNANEDLFVEISGTAGVNAKITFKDGNNNPITPLEAVIAEDRTWTAIIPRQDGGISIIAIAEETGKNPTESEPYAVEAAADKKPLTDLIAEITTKFEGVKVSNDGITDINGNALSKGDKYISKMEYTSMDVMKKLLDKLSEANTLSTYDINYINTVAKPAIDSITVETVKDDELKEFTGLGIRNITDATKDEPVNMNVYGIPEGVINFNITSNNTAVIDVVYNNTNKVWQVTPKLAMTNRLVEVTASADGYKDAVLAFNITTTETTKPSLTLTYKINEEEGSTLEDLAVGNSVYASVYTSSASIANFNVTIPSSFNSEFVKAEVSSVVNDEAQIKITGIKATEVSTPAIEIPFTASATDFEDTTGKFTVSKVSAVPERNESNITLNVGDSGVVKVEIDGTPVTPVNNVYTVENGKTVTFTAIPNTGYQVKEWTGATVDNTVTDKTVAKLQVSTDASVSVEFEEKQIQQPNAIKIVSVKTGENQFTDIPTSTSDSVEAVVYTNTVNGTVYDIYASLSAQKAEFKINNGEVKFILDLVASSDAATFSQEDAKNLLDGLKFDSSKKVLMKEIHRTDGGTGTLDITLSSDVINSLNAENPTEFSITFKYVKGNTTSSDSTILKPLVLKAIKSHIEE